MSLIVPSWKRFLKLTAGWGFLVLGVLGIFLPILQGVLFLAVGFSILATEYEWARRWLDAGRARFPRSAAAIDEGKDRASHFLAKINNGLRRK